MQRRTAQWHGGCAVWGLRSSQNRPQQALGAPTDVEELRADFSLCPSLGRSAHGLRSSEDPYQHPAHAQASLAALVVTGIANRILYKMALVPLGNYVFFLAQFQTFGYVAVYFAVLALRRRCASLA